jgi:hypothetical protein
VDFDSLTRRRKCDGRKEEWKKLVGLFSSVLHVRQVTPAALAAGLDSVMREYGLVRSNTIPVSEQGPDAPAGSIGAYACGPLRGEWCTVVEVHEFSMELWLSEVGAALSKALDTHVLSLVVHDDDVFYYNLDHRGQPLDGYNSNPLYFLDESPPESEIEAQRHFPETFKPILPSGVSIEELSALLGRSWWRAHDAGQLDADGFVRDDDSEDFISAGDHMVAFGTLLRLHGSAGDYPYADWREAGADAWSGFMVAAYARA